MATDPSKESQTKRILAWLLSGKELTALGALTAFGCFRLSARIYDLEKKGHVIHREMIIVNDKKVAKYWIEHEVTV